MPRTPNLAEGLIRSHDLLQTLKSDIDAAYAMLETDRQSQYLRRCVVRAIFVYIEAIVECIKVELRSTVRTGLFTDTLTTRDSETLGPLAVIGAPSGKFLPLEENLKRTFQLAAKIWGLKGFRLSTDGEDYLDFLRAKSARNRLTHPRTIYDVKVTEEDMRRHTISGMWVQSEFQRLMDMCIEKLLSNLSGHSRATFQRRIGRSDQ